ncbi:MAG: PD-(D/E)XK nuclease family protein [Vicinamibacterales bacterium]
MQRCILVRLPADAAAARACAIVVPTRSASEELRRTIEDALLSPRDDRAGARAIAFPDVVTRGELYSFLHARLAGVPPLLSPFDREVLLRRSAGDARIAGAEPPFNPRPGLIPEMLALYDDLRRRHKTVDDFERLIAGELVLNADDDRGAARLLQQTEFLVATFRNFEAALDRAAVENRGIDEHGLRVRLLAARAPLYSHVIVSVADRAADSLGLWAADFDLLARLHGLERLDVIATGAMLDAGFRARLHDALLPGIEEEQPPAAAHPSNPVLLVPDGRIDEAPRAFRCRDREEELAAFVRERKFGSSSALGRTAIVFQRPLPYLYLARQVFEAAEMPWEAADALPLAGEPFAAAIDLVFTAAAAGFTRAALIALLASPHFIFRDGDRPLTRDDIRGVHEHLVKAKYLGGIDRLSALAEDGPAALRTAASAAQELWTAVEQPSAPDQIRAVLAFIAAHERTSDRGDAWYARHMRARAAVLSALESLAAAHAAYDPAPLSIAELSGSVRRWIEGQTFSPRAGTGGVRLLDARTAAYANVDDVRIVGLTEQDWPEPASHSIFYPQSMLAQLGWPSDQDRLASARARFHDLLTLARVRVSLSFCTLEDDAIVPPSPFLDEVDRHGLRTERVQPRQGRVFAHEAMSLAPLALEAVRGPAESWLRVRVARSCAGAEYRGEIGPRRPAPYAVSRLERYLECPFKYFASQVLRLPEERDEEAWMTPQERGRFVHEIFHSFFDEWQRTGRGSITPANVEEALAIFRLIAERHLERVPEGDRALERTLLLGSAAAPGLADRAFAFEIDDEGVVVERLLEHELDGTFAFETDSGPREVALRSKADRIDVLEGGRLRVIDYKLGNAPDRKRALQLPVYGLCAQQALAAERGGAWSISRASYIAFKAKSGYADLKPLDAALLEGQTRLLEAVDGIERGRFPVMPDEPFRCTWCAYPSVCRKDYVGDE